jgi:DNA-directed RNA polymerase specialized sigma24 family protein
MDKLEHEDPVKAQLVGLRFFVGLGIDETARALGMSPATVDRHWAFAKAWLRRELAEEPGRE